MSANRPLRWYVWGVVGAAAVVLATLAATGAAGSRYATWGDLLFLFVLGVVLELIRVPLADGGSISSGFAAFLAAVLLLGPELAASVAALAVLVAALVADRRAPVVRDLFNAGHALLAVLIAGAVYGALGGRPGQISAGGGATFLLLGRTIVAAGLLFLLEMAAVSAAVALERGRRFRSLLAGNLRAGVRLDAAMAGLGLLLALVYNWQHRIFGPYAQAKPFIAVIVFAPAALLYYASRLYVDARRVQDKTLRTLGAVLAARRGGGSALSLDGDPDAVLGTLQEGWPNRRSPAEGLHGAELVVAIADLLGCPPEETAALRHAVYLSDIGHPAPRHLTVSRAAPPPMIGSRLTQHPEAGWRILGQIPSLRPAAQLVRAHHERYDGLGYPVGLRGRQIPLGARILGLVQAFEAHRASGDDSRQAVAQVVAGAGSRFDPRVVEAFQAVMANPRAATLH